LSRTICQLPSGCRRDTIVPSPAGSSALRISSLPLTTAPSGVMLEAAGAPELAPLIADAYGLSARERAVHGAGSPQVDLREGGVSARGELVASLFFEHYAPRLASGAHVGSNGWFAPRG
jgi:hypothetical protein